MTYDRKHDLLENLNKIKEYKEKFNHLEKESFLGYNII